MITTLLTTTQKAVKSAYVPASKLPRRLKGLPFLHTVKLDTHEGRVRVTCVFWDEKTQEFAANVEYIPARIEQEFSACVPARQFKDWINASQLTKEEKAKGKSEQIKFWMGEVMYKGDNIRLYAQAGTARATFNCLNADEFPVI